jgi:hypothetical protein
VVSVEDRQLFEACLVLKNSAQLQPILDWVKQRRESCRDALETQIDVDTIKKLQGEVQAYSKLLALVDDASKSLEKSRQS